STSRRPRRLCRASHKKSPSRKHEGPKARKRKGISFVLSAPRASVIAFLCKAAMRRDFLVALSDGFVYDCPRWQLARLGLAQHRRMVVQRFSGAPCVDELHPGRYTRLLATDPLADLPVGFA